MLAFEDLHIRQNAKNLYNDIYPLFSDIKKDYFFRDQILRATLSISNNIAEGYERQSFKEEVKFLYYAKGSCGEVRSMLHIALDNKLLDQDTYSQLVNKTRQLSIMIHKYIKTKQ